MTGAEGTVGTEAPRVPRRMGRVSAWLFGSALSLVCLLVSAPGIYVAYLIGMALIFAGPVLGVATIVGGGMRRRAIRRELVSTGAGLAIASAPRPDRAFPADRVPATDDGSPLPARTDPVLVARDAADLRLVRQTSLVIAYALVGVAGTISLTLRVLDRSDVLLFSVSPLAFLGAALAVTAPAWAFSRAVAVGEEHALLTRTGSWRAIRALRILALTVGGIATLVAGSAAVSIALGVPDSAWLLWDV